jgi:subtilase family serine protease
MQRSNFGIFIRACAGFVFCVGLSTATTTPWSQPAVSQIQQPIDSSQRVTLTGNTNSFVVGGAIVGPVADNFPMTHMLLLLRRSAARELALEQFIDQLHDRNSPSFHRWLTAEQLGTLYGPATQDVDTVTSWLQSNGFSVGTVYPSGMLIDFSGTASQVQQTFGTPIANFTVGGLPYISNTNDPSIPAALAGVINGIASLNNYFPRPQMRKYDDVQWTAARKTRDVSSLSNFTGLGDFTFTDPQGTRLFVAPGDFNTIYNVNPVWAAGYRGAGQTIVVIEDTSMYAPDWTTFRQAFGLSAYAGTFTQVSPLPPATPASATNCFPTTNSDETEAALDAEWAGVAAPDADIVLAECNDTTTTFGGLIAAENLLNGASPPPIMSVSYGLCEAGGGSALNATFNAAWQQAVTEGTTVIVSAGDDAGSACSAGYPASVFGIGVSSFASTPYNVAVGGTDFRDVADGTSQAYWNTANDASGGSALSYVPEVPWNDSCASGILLEYLVSQGTLTSNDPIAFCNSSKGSAFANIVGGSGGPSGCATGAPTTPGIVGGSCAGYAKPSWQSGVIGIPNDGVRGIPDVSLFASNGFWNHAMWLCNSDYTEGGGTCDFVNDPQDAEKVNAAGGTSFAAPAFAGIQALIDQVSGDRQGNMNVLLYQLAAQQYGSAANPNSVTLSNCNATNGNAIGADCIFQDVTSGDIVVPCIANLPNCYSTTSSTSFNCDDAPCGVLSSSSPVSSSGAYSAGQGWDFATGLGSVNVANLVAAVPSTLPPTALQFTTQPNGVYSAGQAVVVSVGVMNSLGQVSTSDNASMIALTSSSCHGEVVATQVVIGGVAKFANVHMYSVASAVTLTANSSGEELSPAKSTPFNVESNPDVIFHADNEACTP